MRRLFCIALMAMTVPFLSAQGSENAKPGAEGAEKEVMKVISQVNEAQLKGDSAALDRYLADDYIFTNPMGEVMTKRDAVSALKSGNLKFQTFKADDVQLRLYGDTAVATSQVNVKGQRNGQDISGHYRATWVLVKEQGDWHPVAAQATRIADTTVAGTEKPATGSKKATED